MRRWTGVALRRLGIEVAGWTVLLVGIAAIPLPGPGWLMVFLGMAILAQRYTWAERRVLWVKRQALKAASDGVQTVPRIVGSLLGCAWLMALGVFWGLRPIGPPDWWPVADSLWLMGGWGTGAVLIFSGVIALALMVYSLRTFRGSPYDPERDHPPQPNKPSDVSDPRAATSEKLG